MPALVGRRVAFAPTGSGVVVSGMRTKSITINNEAIHITSDDDIGFRTLLDEDPAERSIEMSVEGIVKDDTLFILASSGGSQLISEYTLTLEGLGTFTGNFHIGTLQITAGYKDAVGYTCTISSSGPFTYDATTP